MMDEGGDAEVEDYINRSRSVLAFRNDHGRRVNDNLCIFRSLAHHKNGAAGRLQESQRLFRMWAAHKGLSEDLNDFQGVTLEEIPELETFFKVNIRPYTLQHETNLTAVDLGDYMEEEEEAEDAEPPNRFSAMCLHKPRGIFGTTMNLNMNNSHFSYIKHMNTYCGSWRCESCFMFFGKRGNYIPAPCQRKTMCWHSAHLPRLWVRSQSNNLSTP